MVVKPMIRSNVCLNAHPGGCGINVRKQIDYVRERGAFPGPKRVLVIGGSAGYGLASRIALAFGAGASTFSLSFEKPPRDRRTATVGWYNSEHFVREAQAAGLTAENLYGDAFSCETKQSVIQRVIELFGQVDLVIYSLASGVRTDPTDGTEYRSVLKSIGEAYEATSVNPETGALSKVTIDPATDAEAEATVKVMGGEDWEMWMRGMLDNGVLAPGATTLAYSYIGPDLTKPIYRDGTIGRAKDHLESTAARISRQLESIGGHAYVSINKAVVTRASSVIPVVPLYLATLFPVMAERGTHEGPIEQMYRLFADRAVDPAYVAVDDAGRIRMDDWEMADDVQKEVADRWTKLTGEVAPDWVDLAGFRDEFLNIHGFGYDEIDYEADIPTDLPG
jgi:enoyl-[acyl-carrier protein] reductase / trans-2-enoyl-CoA reductase (NAD+)